MAAALSSACAQTLYNLIKVAFPPVRDRCFYFHREIKHYFSFKCLVAKKWEPGVVGVGVGLQDASSKQIEVIICFHAAEQFLLS